MKCHNESGRDLLYVNNWGGIPKATQPFVIYDMRSFYAFFTFAYLIKISPVIYLF